MKKNREYWSKRSEQLEEVLLNRGESFANDLDNQYKIANTRIQKEIYAWYQRFAKNNCISLAEAKRLLNTNELKEFRWTVQDYINYGQKNAVNPYWLEELENASAKVHISRLESLKLQLQQQVEFLYGNQLDGLDKTMRDIYSEGYYHTVFEIQKGFNAGYSFSKFNENELEKVISKPWALDGENFSSRVWKNKSKLINTLHTNLTQALIRGDNPEKIVGNIASTVETSRKAARRLVMTESAYFSAASQKDCYSDLNIEQYEIVATLDSHTSKTCQELDGKVFKMSDYEPGVTAPPFHCYCRSCTAPYFNDEFTIGEKRVARSINDKTEYIPSNIKYPEWKKKYVKDGKSDIIKEQTFLEKIQAVRDEIKENDGVVAEEHLKKAGSIVQNKLIQNRNALKIDLDKATEEYKAFGWDELTKEKEQLEKINKGINLPQDFGYKTNEEVSKRYKEIKSKLLELMDNPQLGEAQIKMHKAKLAYKGTQEYNISDLKKKLSEIRSMGTGELDVTGHLNNSKSPMRKVVANAYDNYPTEWIEKSIAHGNLTPKKVDRGYYSEWDKVIAISDNGGDSSLKTALHELGHRFERAIPEIKEAEKVFYERRTKGEPLQWLGYPYAYSEKSRFDNFLDKYMGKDYGGSAYELVSMGFEYAYTNPTLLWQDEDFATWIYGILTLY